MQIKKPETFEELLELQRILDENTTKTRENGFTPRQRNEIDIILSLDDELQEWLKELPSELNFKTWKQKEYSRDKEHEEITDILFFILQLTNYEEFYKIPFKKSFDDWVEPKIKTVYETELEARKIIVYFFKKDLYHEQFRDDILEDYKMLCNWRKFSKQDILDKYFEKWQKNMERINKDWTLKGEQNGNVQCK